MTMPNIPEPDERAGWELIWRHGNGHPRYGSYAAPDAAVMDWATTLPAGGFVLDLGCGVGRHVVYLGGCGFRMAGIDIAPSGIRLIAMKTTRATELKLSRSLRLL